MQKTTVRVTSTVTIIVHRPSPTPTPTPVIPTLQRRRMSTPRPAVALPAQYPYPLASKASSSSSSTHPAHPTMMRSMSSGSPGSSMSITSRLRAAVPRNIAKQLKLVLPGVVITYIFNTVTRLLALLDHPSSWQRFVPFPLPSYSRMYLHTARFQHHHL